MEIRARAFLFDLDGTLIDSIAAVDRAWSTWALSHGYDPVEVLPKIHGRRAIDSLKAHFSQLDAVSEELRLRGIETMDTEGIIPLPGALAFLESLHSNEWTVVTSGTRDVAEARMKAGGIRIPGNAVYGEDVANGKPAPDPYALAAFRLGVPPEQCVVFEDTSAGVASGKAAGMRVVSVGNIIGLADAFVADYVGLEVKRDLGTLRLLGLTGF